MGFPETPSSLVLLLIFLQSIFHSLSAELCQMKSQWGFALEHSQYTSFLTSDYPHCLLYCLQDQSHCKSLTYDQMSKICKMNSKTRWSNPSQYMKKSNHIYKEMLNTTNQSTTQTSSTASTAGHRSSTTSTTGQTNPTDSTARVQSSTDTAAGLTSSADPTTGLSGPTDSAAGLTGPTASTVGLTGPTASTVGLTGSTYSTVGLTGPTASTVGLAGSTVSTSPTSSINDFCGGKQDGHYDHPSDCNKYVTCKFGLTWQSDCASAPSYVTGVCGKC